MKSIIDNIMGLDKKKRKTQIQLSHLLACWHWTNFLISLNLNFQMYKMNDKIICNLMGCWDFPGFPVVKTQSFHCRGHRFSPWSENQDLASCCMVQKIKKERNNIIRVKMIHAEHIPQCPVYSNHSVIDLHFLKVYILWALFFSYDLSGSFRNYISIYNEGTNTRFSKP